MPTTTPDFAGYDPGIAAAMSSTAIQDLGGLPAFLNIATTDVGPGYLTCELPVSIELLNPFGAAHGGVMSALVDHVLGAVCLPLIEPGAWPATLEYKVNLLAPARVGTMRARADIVALSRRTAVVRVDVTDGRRLIGSAQGTVSIVPPRKPADVGPPTADPSQVVTNDPQSTT